MNFPPVCFPARMTAIGAMLQHIVSVCQQCGLSKVEQMRVELVLEELFTNTVHHGYGQDCDQPVWISASYNDDGLSIVYQDEAPAYNPLDRPTVQIPPTLGGLGITLVENIATTHYSNENGRNTLTLEF